MSPNPDDRSDNVQKLQENINNTLKNINLANDVIAKSNDPSEVQNMKERNAKREEALESMRSEIREEAMANKNNMH
ncbi:MAG: small acid-soluble spore protein Tlp [Clostridium sp.]|nr:small acid-soluble spore protein Tlp [Clostridium sp.]